MSIQLKSDGKNKQVRIEKDGVVISSIIPELHYGDSYEIRSWEVDVDWDFKLKIYGSFLVVFASGWPIKMDGCVYWHMRKNQHPTIRLTCGPD